MTYRELQRVLRRYKEVGLTTIKLNSKYAELCAEYDVVSKGRKRGFMASTVNPGKGGGGGNKKRSGGGGASPDQQLSGITEFQKDFEKAFREERKFQELNGGVVAISPDQVAARMKVGKSEFNKLFKQLESRNLVFTAKERNGRKMVAIAE